MRRRYFRTLLFRKIILAAFCACSMSANAQQLLKGRVFSSDSSAMPFVYLINKSNGNGTMSDSEGRFSMLSSAADTLICAYIGFLKLQLPVSKVARDVNGEARIVMTPLPFNLSQVNVTAFRIKPYEREYMQDIIDRSRMKKMDMAYSPITALYMRYSKEGRQINKLAKIFEQLLIDEQVGKKFNREILLRLTGDDKIDFDAFRKYCYYLDDQFIIHSEGVELYSRIMDCYKRYKAELNR
jgi:hypothetical protein